MLQQLFLRMVEYFQGDARRIQHFIKVHALAKYIGEYENLTEKEMFILEAAAYVHDIGILMCEEKYGDCSGGNQEKEGPALARKMLSDLGFPEDETDRIAYLVGHHHTYADIKGMDYQILVESDFLVNLYEDDVPESGVREAYGKIFKTAAGKRLCALMYADKL